MTFARRVAIITGGSRGIGRGIALRLALDGFNVVVSYHSNAAKAQEVVAEVAALRRIHLNENQQPVRAIAVQADASKTEDGKRLLDETIAAFGRLDVVVFNAASVDLISIREVNEQSYLDAFNTNVKGPLFFSKLAQPYLAKAQEEAAVVQNGGSPLGGSRIISISAASLLWSDVKNVFLVYNMTKGALNQMTRVLARDPDFGGKGITVNGVAPGAVETDTLGNVAKSILDEVIAKQPTKRLGQVGDIADVVSFLASNDSRWVNGQTIMATGGGTV